MLHDNTNYEEMHRKKSVWEQVLLDAHKLKVVGPYYSIFNNWTGM